MIRAFSVIFLLLLFSFCYSLEIKPLNTTEKFPPQCYKAETGSIKDNLSPIEIEMVNKGAVKSKALYMKSDFGMIEETVRLFIQKDTVSFVIHLFGSIDQIIERYSAQLRIYNMEIDLGNLKLESKDINGGMFDEELSGKLAVKDFSYYVNSEKMELLIDGISFEIPLECREEWRNLFRIK